MSYVSYSAVVLTEKSRDRLIKRFTNIIPSEYKIIAHHMTINLGKLDSEYVKYLGLPVKLIVTDYAINDHVVSVGVDGFYSKNKKPHITLAVNVNNNSKPKDSKDIDANEYIRLSKPIIIFGKVTEVEI